MRIFIFKQVYPLPADTKTLFKDAKRIIVIENNFSGQFSSLLEKHGVNVSDRVVKYDGEPFSVEELVEKMQNQE